MTAARGNSRWASVLPAARRHRSPAPEGRGREPSRCAGITAPPRSAWRWAAAALLGLCFAAFPGASLGQDQAPNASPPAAAPAPASIAPAEVAARTTEATNRLAALAGRLSAAEEVAAIRQSFFRLSLEMERGMAETEATLAGQPTQAALQARQASWQSQRAQLEAWLGVLTQRAVELQEGLGQLAALRTQWVATRDAPATSAAPPATRRQIDGVLAAIEAAEEPLRGRHDGLLGLQSLISGALARCDEALTRIAQAQRGAAAGLLDRDHRPLWDAAQLTAARTALPTQLRDLAVAFREDLTRYLREPARELPLHAGLLALLAGVCSGLRRLHRRWSADARQAAPRAAVFERPWSAALFTVWFVATRYAAPTPLLVKAIFSLLALAPLLRLVAPALPPGLMPAVYALGALYALDILREILGGTAIVEQALLVLEGLGGLMLLGGWEASGRRALDGTHLGGRLRPGVRTTLGRLAMLGLAAGTAAGALGYMPLGRLVAPGLVSAAALGLALYASVRVAGGLLAAALRTRPLGRLQMVQRHRELLERRTYRLLVWAAVIGWATRSLDHIGLLEPMLGAALAALDMKLERGSISISVGDILAFAITIWASCLISGFLRFALQEEVYPRARVPGGTAYAASRLVHYTVLTLGFVMGLGLLGMDLTRVSVLAGALGVGIGFGLQSVVNNVVCGLILLFERPIHVGDTIEVGGLFGEVRRIGFRACTVRTRRGADIIIPNADFITANVTNWTYSDRLRRIDIPVGVNYASAPKRVIDVLEAVAAANPQVLKVPPPRGLHIGYGDSAINFELRVWTDQSSDYVQVRSDLNAAVYDAVQEAGMSFPFPQREVRLLGASAAQAPDPTPDPGDAPA